MLWRNLPFVLFLILAGCPALYTTSPRYGGKRQIKPRKPSSTTIIRHPIEEKKGMLPWPVAGNVISNFGVQVDQKYGTKTKNLGIDISCKRGSPVKAIYQGKVSYADVFMGQGLMVILEHGGGYYSVYSRLEEIKVNSGEKVEAGEVLGLSSDVAHFEIRVGGIAVDPIEWLEKR
ncbi:MAG: peptidoglycan DD-metalloendopeptidase family protein [candidate division WOR-3 bacterium]